MPTNAPDVRKYAEAIKRFSDLLSLLSLIPVLIECRFSSRRFGAAAQQPAPAEQPKGKDKKEGAKDKKPSGGEAPKSKPEAQPEEADSGALPLGIASVLLWLAAEVIACPSLFLQLPKTKAGKYTEAIDNKGPLGSLLRGIKEAQGKLAKSQAKGGDASSWGTVDTVSAILVHALDTHDAFVAAHGIVMLVALGAVLTALMGHMIGGSARQLVDKGVKPLLRGAGLMVPVAVFVYLNRHLLAKACVALQKEKLVTSLEFPLRAASLIAARGPLRSGQAGSTPTSFATFQAGSLASLISIEIANGGLAKAIAPFTTEKFMDVAWGSPMFTYVAPVAVALLWMSLVHLQRKPLQLFVTTVLSVVSTPMVLHNGWAQLSPMLGMASSADAHRQLVQFMSYMYSMASVAVFLAGGTTSLLATVLVAQGLVRIHGVEPFAALGAA